MNLYEIGLPDPEQFNIKDVIVAGDECVLITPKDMGVEWNDHNKVFRSSVWRKSDGQLISAGFKKFVNYLEKPEFEPLPADGHLEIITKVDGSLAIISHLNGELIVRTRGTVDASQLENGHEVEMLKNKYPKAFDNCWVNSENYTLLFEWTTPTNRIVLQESAEPTLWLIGIVHHRDYSYAPQKDLDFIAKYLGVNRPKTFDININGDVDQLKKAIEPLEDIEGVVVYAGNGQILKKIKTLRYLHLHRVFTGVKSVDHLFDLWVEYGCLNRQEFEQKLTVEFDWELVVTLKNLTDDLYNRWNYIQQKLATYKQYVKIDWFAQMNRKDQAATILRSFVKDAGIVFAVLDGKQISPDKLWKNYSK